MQHHYSKTSVAILLTLAAACINPGNLHAQWGECSAILKEVKLSEASSGSEGCGQEAESGVGKLRIGVFNRRYKLELPVGYDNNKPYPVIFAFHGAMSDADEYSEGAGLAEAAGNEAIIVYGQAKLYWPFPATRKWDTAGQGDLKYFDEILERVSSETCVDSERIFATGHSSGAFFSSRLGCERGNVLRGIAPLAGDLRATPDDHAECVGSVAVWMEHGDDDIWVRPADGRDMRDYWLAANSCAEIAGAEECSCTEDAPEECKHETCTRYTCDGGAPAVWCEAVGGGHETRPTFTAPAAWNFFKRL